MALHSCTTEKKATRYLNKHREASSRYCSKFIVPVDSTPWEYYGDAGVQEPIKPDTVFINLPNGIEIAYVHDTISRKRTVYKENTAALQASRDSTAKYVGLFNQYYKWCHELNAQIQSTPATQKVVEKPSMNWKDWLLIVIAGASSMWATYKHRQAKKNV